MGTACWQRSLVTNCRDAGDLGLDRSKSHGPPRAVRSSSGDCADTAATQCTIWTLHHLSNHQSHAVILLNLPFHPNMLFPGHHFGGSGAQWRRALPPKVLRCSRLGGQSVIPESTIPHPFHQYRQVAMTRLARSFLELTTTQRCLRLGPAVEIV